MTNAVRIVWKTASGEVINSPWFDESHACELIAEANAFIADGERYGVDMSSVSFHVKYAIRGTVSDFGRVSNDSVNGLVLSSVHAQ